MVRDDGEITGNVNDVYGKPEEDDQRWNRA
jgi:hypothetical protein